jgi:hypothetical protein
VNIPAINGFPELKLAQPIAAQIGKSRVTAANFAEHIPESLASGQSVTIPCLLQFDDSVSQVTLQLSLASADQHWLLGDPKTVAIPGDWPTNAPFQVVLDGVVPRNIESDDHAVLLLSITNRTDSAQIPLGRVGVQARPHLFDIPNPDRLVDAAVQFDEVALLRGYRLDLSQLGQENGQVSLDLYWQALAETDVAYKTFVHLLDAEGNIITQVDREPQAGAAPTTSWLENEIIIDQFVFPVDQALSNVARLVLGLYDPSTGIRAPIVTGPDDKREDSYYEITF